MKTIKQIADELGVDKQRVYRYIRKNRISEAHQNNSVMFYDDVVENLIKSHFKKNTTSSEAHQEAHQTASSAAVNDTVIKLLQQELEIKNKQIADLTTALSETSKALHAAQALHAGTMQKQFLPESSSEKRGGLFGSLWLKIKKPP